MCVLREACKEDGPLGKGLLMTDAGKREGAGSVEIRLPSSVNIILDTLHRAGFEAYVVGGCVRDSILGRTPDDWDITTSAMPQQTKKLFRRTVDTGIQHGTVTVLIGSEQFEVTTYRIDGDYEDGRHPEKVTFTRSLLEDLKRRDFTINAMAYSEESGIVDEFDGMGDIRRGVIRAVGDPRERFSEDALRIMRAVRFAAQLDYRIDPPTESAVRELAGNLRKISAERIRTELVKLLVSAHPDRMRDVWSLGITRVILPEFDACMACPQNNPHHIYSVGEHILHTLSAVPADTVLRMTMLLHDIGKPNCRSTDADGIDHFCGHAEKSAEMADGIMRRLKFDNATRKKTVQLIRFHDLRIGPDAAQVRRAMVQVGPDLFPDLLAIWRADAAAKAPATREKIERTTKAIEETAGDIFKRGDCLSLGDLAVNGGDLLRTGRYKGAQIGRILNRMLGDVVDDPSRNSREYLLQALDEGRYDA
jgi:tRNA nucleotidyltransferase (CCA-adding enzyme)